MYSHWEFKSKHISPLDWCLCAWVFCYVKSTCDATYLMWDIVVCKGEGFLQWMRNTSFGSTGKMNKNKNCFLELFLNSFLMPISWYHITGGPNNAFFQANPHSQNRTTFSHSKLSLSRFTKTSLIVSSHSQGSLKLLSYLALTLKVHSNFSHSKLSLSRFTQTSLIVSSHSQGLLKLLS